MRLSDVIKQTLFTEIDVKTLHPSVLSAQYNPDRFDFYARVHDGDPSKILDISFSPHVRMLKQYQKVGNKIFWKQWKKTSYYRMQRLYGRDRSWIKNKMIGFINLLKRIENDADCDMMEILQNPLIKNKYNSSYEIWEGHHRASCFYVLDKKCDCRIIVAKRK